MSLHALFAPSSVAVIGASTQAGSVGNDIAKNLIQSDFSGKVYPVNPKAETLFGVPCYKSISDIVAPVDLAVIVVPAPIVPTVLREAGEKMVRAAIIISAGFKETGEEGAKLEKEVREIATEYKMSILGPNCLGFIEPRFFLNASFASATPKAGNIAFFSQSGALMSALLDEAKEALGFSAFVSIGNKAVLDESSLLKHFKDDEATGVIGLYTEGLTDAENLIATGRSLLAGKKPKPVVVLKSGQTDAGTHASSSHTGAVAGSALAYAALFKQARLLQAHTFEELLEYLSVISGNPLPSGNRVAIVTNAGGLGVLATDAAVSHGLVLAPLSEKTQTELRKILPPAASVANPVDILGDALADRYAHALSVVAADTSVDLLLVILTPQTMTEPEKTAQAILEIRKKQPKLPIAVVFGGHDLVTPGTRLLQKSGVPCFSFPESGARALAGLSQIGTWRDQKEKKNVKTGENPGFAETKRLMEKMEEQGKSELSASESEKILTAYGFPFLKSSLASSPEEALALAKSIGGPVALKIVSPEISHKSDVGGVLLNVSPEEADVAYKHMMATVKVHAPHAGLQGAQVVEMAKEGGLELLLGLKREPGLGTFLVFGLGGIYVETLKDISMRFVPMTENDIDELIHEIKSFPLLAGVRGQKGIDMDTLKNHIMRLSQFALDFPEVEELDLNPLLAFPSGDQFRILDARIQLAKK